MEQIAKQFSANFYSSTAYKKARRSYIAKRIEIDGGMCEHCRRRPGRELDHIEELTEDNVDDPWVTLSHDNYQWLCGDCHKRKTLSRARCVFDDEGNPIFIKK